MAKKRKAKKKASPAVRYRTKTVTKYRTRRAPLRIKTKTIRRRDESLNLNKIVRGSIAAGFGMVVAKVAVNKLTSGGSETERWSWPNIFMAAGSALVVAFAGGALLKLKKPTVATIAMGGVGLALYKIFTTKLAPKWGWTESWFGGEDEIDPAMLGYGADEIDVLDYDSGVGSLPGQVMGATNAGGLSVPFNPYMGATDTGGKVLPYNPYMGAADYGQMSRRVASGYPGSY